MKGKTTRTDERKKQSSSGTTQTVINHFFISFLSSFRLGQVINSEIHRSIISHVRSIVYAGVMTKKIRRRRRECKKRGQCLHSPECVVIPADGRARLGPSSTCGWWPIARRPRPLDIGWCHRPVEHETATSLENWCDQTAWELTKRNGRGWKRKNKKKKSFVASLRLARNDFPVQFTQLTSAF